ncbi:MAG: host specificity protein, partial [Myxococcota bacterium]
MALFASATDDKYTLDQVLSQQSTIGTLITPLLRGPVGLWDRQAAVQVRLINGTLQGFDRAAVLAGSAAIAIGDGAAGNWEVLQYTAAAVPTDPEATERDVMLSGFLRGQAGTSAIMPDIWPEGSRVVLLDNTLRQMNLASSSRGVEQYMRYGPANLPYDDPTYREVTETFQGAGLRPFPVVHLRAERSGTTV